MKIPDCVGVSRQLLETLRKRHRCLLYAHNRHIVCLVHPDGVDGDSCLDFRENPNIKPEELWQPEGASY
ncbi:MAG: hypothetical protein V7K27_08695 [Nostoc sp.]|uniref:hypothetical protein n=1 Tax=Nostoc sp. TaxID=1180 RepID=UPI002FF7A600